MNEKRVNEKDEPVDTLRLLIEKDPDHAFESWDVSSVAALARGLITHHTSHHARSGEQTQRDQALAEVERLRAVVDEALTHIPKRDTFKPHYQREMTVRTILEHALSPNTREASDE